MSTDRHTPNSPDRPARSSLRARLARPLALVAAIALLLPLVVAEAQQSSLNAPSPAEGHARVVAQGVVQFPGDADGQFVCRVVERIAEPLDTAKYEEQVLGFVIATDGPVILADDTNDGAENVARVAPGEIYLVQDGVRQRRASADGNPVKYLALEIVPASRADEVGDGKLIIKTDPIGAPSGAHDLDLVQDVLAMGDTGNVSQTNGMVILATDGAIDVIPRGGRSRTLQPGEAGIFGNDVQVQPVDTGGSAKRSPLSPISLALNETAPVSGAAYLACVIGPEIPPANSGPQIVPRDEDTAPDQSQEPSDQADDSAPTEELTLVAEPTPTQRLPATTNGDSTGRPTVFRTPVIQSLLPQPTETPEPAR